MAALPAHNSKFIISAQLNYAFSSCRLLNRSKQNHREILQKKPSRQSEKIQIQISKKDTWASLVGR